MKRRKVSLPLALFISDIVIISIGLLLSSWMRSTFPLGRTGALAETQTQIPPGIFLLTIMIWSIALISNSVYDPKVVLRWYNEASQIIWSGIIAITLSAGALYFTFRELPRLQLIYFFVVTILLLLLERATLRVIYRLVGTARPSSYTRIVIAGAGQLGQRIAGILRNHGRWGFALSGYLDDDPNKVGLEFNHFPVIGVIDDLPRIIDEYAITEVWVALPVQAYERIDEIVLAVDTLPVRLKIVPDYLSFALIRAKTDILGGVPIIGLREPVIEGFTRILKRLFDIAIVSALLLFFAPIMILIAVAIKLDTPGPVLYRQKRVGENWREFEMLKFRTMVADAEKRMDEVARQTAEGKVIHKRPDDPRVTRVGRFLRRFSLDELPQFINVLKGDMSLVGPRPEMPWLVDLYEPWQRKRFAVPQGVTGWWQINGRSDKPMHLNTDYDLYYVYNYSLWLDLIILLRTPGVVLRGRGAF